jgi:tetratricopeptide (TPR) repeat protein
MLATELSVGERLRTIPEENVVRAMLDLHLHTTDGYARDTLRALHKDLGSDYVVAGSYVALPEKSGGQIRLDLRLQDTGSGETLASIAVSGNQSEVFDLVARAGTEIRAKLGVQAEPREVAAWRTALPSNPDGVRLYSEGLRRMRVFDNMSARDLLDKAVAAQPDFALAHSALAQVWSALGYDSRALASAQKAMELSKNLPEDQRLEIEGHYFEMKRDWAGAIGVYRHLWQDHPDDLEFGLRLARVEGSKGDIQAGMKTLAALRNLPSPQKDDPRIDLAEGSLAALKSDYKRQRELARQAAAKARNSGARLLLARARLVEGWALDDQSQFPEAIAAFSAAEDLFRDAGDRNGMATAFNDLGIVLQKQGDLAGAREKLSEARAGFEHIGDENGLGAALTNLGEVYRAQGELKQAEELYQQALRIFRRTGRKDNEYATMNNLGAVLFQRGDFRAAGRFFEELLAARQAAGDKNGVALAKTNLGDVLRVQGKLDSAAQLLNEALATFRELGDQATAAGVQLSIAKTLLAQRSFSAARQSMEDALAINQKIGAKGDEAYARVWLARVALEEGRPGPVEATLDAAISELDKEHRTADQTEAFAVKARALLRQGLAQQARESVQRARAVRAVDWLARFQLSIVSARVQAALGKNAAAKRELVAAKLDAQRTGCAICELEVQ